MIQDMNSMMVAIITIIIRDREIIWIHLVDTNHPPRIENHFEVAAKEEGTVLAVIQCRVVEIQLGVRNLQAIWPQMEIMKVIAIVSEKVREGRDHAQMDETLQSNMTQVVAIKIVVAMI